jgi:hypothetical protein
LNKQQALGNACAYSLLLAARLARVMHVSAACLQRDQHGSDWLAGSAGFTSHDVTLEQRSEQMRGASCRDIAASLPGSMVCRLDNPQCAIQAQLGNGGFGAGQFGFSDGKLFGWPGAAERSNADITAAATGSPSQSEKAEHATHSADGLEERTSAFSHGTGSAAEQHPAAAVPTLQLTPRVFVLSPSGRCVEFLRPGVYERYSWQHSQQQGVTELRSDVGSLTVHRFVHHLSPSPPVPEPLPVAEGVSSEVPETIRAVGSLRVPSRLYPAVSTGLVLPRVAAARPAPKATSALPPVLLMREFLLHQAPSAELLQRYRDVVATVEQDAPDDDDKVQCCGPGANLCCGATD